MTVEPKFATTTAGLEKQERLPDIEPELYLLSPDSVKILEAFNVKIAKEPEKAPEPVLEDSYEVEEALDSKEALDSEDLLESEEAELEEEEEELEIMLKTAGGEKSGIREKITGGAPRRGTVKMELVTLESNKKDLI